MFIVYASTYNIYPDTLDNIFDTLDEYTYARTEKTESKALDEARKLLAFVQGKSMIKKRYLSAKATAHVYKLEANGELTLIQTFESTIQLSKRKF